MATSTSSRCAAQPAPTIGRRGRLSREVRPRPLVAGVARPASCRAPRCASPRIQTAKAVPGSRNSSLSLDAPMKMQLRGTSERLRPYALRALSIRLLCRLALAHQSDDGRGPPRGLAPPHAVADINDGRVAAVDCNGRRGRAIVEVKFCHHGFWERARGLGALLSGGGCFCRECCGAVHRVARGWVAGLLN